MIRRVKKQHPALKPLRTSFSASLAYSLVICLVATVLPLYESVNLWTLLLFVLTAAVALPHILPKFREVLPRSKPTPSHLQPGMRTQTFRKYDRVLHAVLLGSLGFIAYSLYFTTRSISGYGVDVSSLEHASATTLTYLTIFLGCTVSILLYRKNQRRVLIVATIGVAMFLALPYAQIGQTLGFGKLSASDMAVSIALSLAYLGLLFLLRHWRKHTRTALLADHPTETLAHHVSKR